MPSIVDCPSCNRKLRVPDELMTGQVQCPTCGSTFAARNGPSPAPPPAWEQPAPPPSSSRARRADDDEEVPLSRSRRGRHLQPHRGTLILVLGILSIVPHGLHLILGPIAWILGNNDLKEIRAGRMDAEGEGTTQAGRICGIIGTIMGLVGLLIAGLIICIWFGFVAMILGAAASQPTPRPQSPPPVRRPGMEMPVHRGSWLAVPPPQLWSGVLRG